MIKVLVLARAYRYMMRRLLVLFCVESESKRQNWVDGFTESLRHLADTGILSVQWINIAQKCDRRTLLRPKDDEVLSADYILVKSGFMWKVDRFWRQHECTIRSTHEGLKNAFSVIAISSIFPPSIAAKKHYSGLLYETEWYKDLHGENFTRWGFEHQLAFGIYKLSSTTTKENEESTKETLRVNDILLPPPTAVNKRPIDFICITTTAAYKQNCRLNSVSFSGYKLCIGVSPTSTDGKMLTETGWKCTEAYLDRQTIHYLLSQTKTALLPMSLDGGGERFMLEAMSAGCFCAILDENNVKLQRLYECSKLNGVPDHTTYAGQILHLLNRLHDGASCQTSPHNIEQLQKTIKNLT